MQVPTEVSPFAGGYEIFYVNASNRRVCEPTRGHVVPGWRRRACIARRERMTSSWLVK